MPPPHGGDAAHSTVVFLLFASVGGGATSVVGCSWRLGAVSQPGPAAGAVWIGAQQALSSRQSAVVGGPAQSDVATVGWGGARAALPWAAAWRVGRAGYHGGEVAPLAVVPRACAAAGGSDEADGGVGGGDSGAGGCGGSRPTTARKGEEGVAPALWTAVARGNVGAVCRALWPATAGSPDGDGEDGDAGVEGGVEEALTAHRLRSVMGADAPPPRDARGLLLAAVAPGSAPVVGVLLETGHFAGGTFLPSLAQALWAAVEADAPAVATELLTVADCAWPGSDAADVALPAP